MRTRKLPFLALVVAILAIPPLSGGASAERRGEAHASTTRVVTIDDDVFEPRSIRVKKGDLVRFEWEGINRHNAVGFRGQEFSTGSNGRVSGAKAIRIRAARGTLIRYLCEFHPEDMRGSIRVSRFR